LTEDKNKRLTEAATTEDVKELLTDIVKDIDALKSQHPEVTKVFLSQKNENTIIVMTNLTDDADIDAKSEALEKDIVAKAFNGKALDTIGIKYTKGTSKPLRLAYSVVDVDKFAGGNASAEAPAENAKELTMDKVVGLDLLTSEADKQAIAKVVNKINSTVLKSTISGITLTKGADFLAVTISIPEASDEQTVKSIVSAMASWTKQLGWRYDIKANAPSTSKSDGKLNIKFMPIYKNFFVEN
jgi:hypothetical protein